MVRHSYAWSCDSYEWGAEEGFWLYQPCLNGKEGRRKGMARIKRRKKDMGGWQGRQSLSNFGVSVP